MGHLRIVFQITKFNKYDFWLREMDFLDHIVSGNDIMIDPKKIEYVKNLPRLWSSSVIKRFLYVAEYYRRFVEGFSSFALPLTKLSQKKVKFQWLDDCEKSFQILKNHPSSASILTLSKGVDGFDVYCDASHVGLICLLMQHVNVILYGSTQLKVHNHNDPTRHLELMAVVFALNIWHH